MNHREKTPKARCKVPQADYKTDLMFHVLFLFVVALGKLLQTASDKNTNVVEAVHTSLLKIAERNTNEVLLACCSAVENPTDKNQENLLTILCIMERICQDHIQKVDGTSIAAIIQLSIQIMKQINEQDKLQQPASDIMVALGREHCALVSCFRKTCLLR